MVCSLKDREIGLFCMFSALKLNFTSIRGLRSIFVGCESFQESNLSDILSLYETNLEDSIDSSNFFMWTRDFHLYETYPSKTLRILIFAFDWLYFVQCLISFSSISHCLRHCARLSMLFNRTSMKLSQPVC